MIDNITLVKYLESLKKPYWQTTILNTGEVSFKVVMVWDSV